MRFETVSMGVSMFVAVAHHGDDHHPSISPATLYALKVLHVLHALQSSIPSSMHHGGVLCPVSLLTVPKDQFTLFITALREVRRER